MNQELPSSLINRLSDIAKEKDDYILNDRIQRELKPVIEGNETVLSSVADALQEEDPEKMQESLSLLQEAFHNQNCQIVEDDSLPNDNWGSISFENNQWTLRVRPEMTRAIPFALTEYVHELGALGLIQKSLQLRNMEQPVNLNFEKNRLVIRTRDGEVSLTHLFDQVFRKLVEARQLNQTDVEQLIPLDYVNPAKQ